MKKYWLATISLMLILFMNGGCATHRGYGGTGSLSELSQLRPTSYPGPKSDKESAIRAQALQETALTIGAQAALASRSTQINKVLDANDTTLSRVFDFRTMMLANNVLPPVLSEGRQSLNLDDPNSIRLSDRVYKIESQAHFVTGIPTWRDYIWMDYAQPERPDNTLLPKNAKERKIWRENVATGWENGLHQADSIYAENLARLKRDYNGMVLYRKLLAQGMVSAPYVAKANLGVTGDGNDMRINDQVLRITALPNLQLHSKNWRPVFTQ